MFKFKKNMKTLSRSPIGAREDGNDSGFPMRSYYCSSEWLTTYSK